jgi:hypothetical protein
VNILALYSPSEVPLTEPAKSALLSSSLPVSTITFDAAAAARRLLQLDAQIDTPMPAREEERKTAARKGGVR